MYLGQAVDLTILTTLSAITAQQANPTEETNQRVKQLLDYLTTQEEAVLTYCARNTVLAAHSDTSYLSKSTAGIRAG